METEPEGTSSDIWRILGGMAEGGRGNWGGVNRLRSLLAFGRSAHVPKYVCIQQFTYRHVCTYASSFARLYLAGQHTGRGLPITLLEPVGPVANFGNIAYTTQGGWMAGWTKCWTTGAHFPEMCGRFFDWCYWRRGQGSVLSKFSLYWNWEWYMSGRKKLLSRRVLFAIILGLRTT